MSDPNADFDHAVLDKIDASPIGAVPTTPAYQDALRRLYAAQQVYASADHKGGHVTTRSLAQLPCFHAHNLEAFIAGIDACTDPEAKQTLQELCTLFALTSLEADAGWFLAHNRMSDARAKALRKQINQVCHELRPRAIALVEGLGVPQEWLGSAMLEG